MSDEKKRLLMYDMMVTSRLGMDLWRRGRQSGEG